MRGIARKLAVSEGTAYRAIKEAELQGWVSAIDRIGTVRIERKKKANIDHLTFAEVVNIVEGTVLGGRDGLHKTLQKFVIGAMQADVIVPYIEPDSLMIVGNREEVQLLSLSLGAAVLITGGFEASETVQQLANEKHLPIISCSYDTFTTATLINRAIYDRLIKKDILFVEDVVANQTLATVRSDELVSDYLQVVASSGHERVPVVDDDGRLIGIVTARDVADAQASHPIHLHMSRQPVTVSLKTTIASAAHRMVWEGIELLPVVHHRKLVGVLSRQDVIKALQLMSRQPQIGDTLQDIVVQAFDAVRNDDRSMSLVGSVTPQMTNAVGTLATGSLMTLMEYCSLLCLQQSRDVELVVENVSVYSLKPVSVDSRIEVRARVLDFGRRFAKVDIEVYDQTERAVKALLTAQVLER